MNLSKTSENISETFNECLPCRVYGLTRFELNIIFD